MKFADAKIIEAVTLAGLTLAPSQVSGSIRLVPVLRPGAPGDLRIARRQYDEELAGVGAGKDCTYFSYIPHGLVMSWSDDGSAIAANGSQLKGRDGRVRDFEVAKIRWMQRIAQRETGNSLRLLPLHLAMEGFLSLYFSGPNIVWTEYSKRVVRHGLTPRTEWAYDGESIAGFENALRIFEIHENQVGVLVFVADAMASAFVVSTPDDYRSLHRTLLADFFGELIWQYALMYKTVMPLTVGIDEADVDDLAGLREAVSNVRHRWGEFHGVMAADLLGRPVRSQSVYQAGPFTLQRFMTDLDLDKENHFGEAIVREDGTMEYLKTYRLSAAQARRAYLLSQLAVAQWNLDDAATSLQTTRNELVLRLEKAGFGYLIEATLRTAASKSAWLLRKKGPFEK